MYTWKELEGIIDNTVELSTICRKEWCRTLESDIDDLSNELHDYLKSGEVHERFCLNTVSRKMMKGYRNTGPVMRVYS
jgi:hypothetical protein